MGKFTKEPFQSIVKTIQKLEPSKLAKCKLIVLIAPSIFLKTWNLLSGKVLYFDYIMQFFEKIKK
jgi:hypothetical protein